MLRPIRLLAIGRFSNRRYAWRVGPTERSFREKAQSFYSANRIKRPSPGPNILRNHCGRARTLNPASLTFGWRRNRRLHGLVTKRCIESRELE